MMIKSRVLKTSFGGGYEFTDVERQADPSRL